MKCLISIIILLAFIGLSYDGANAAENLEDWTFYVWQGNITMTPSGTIVNVQTPGSDLEEWARLSKDFPSALGVIMTVNISSVNEKAYIGIRKNLGVNEAGNRILADIQVSEDSGDMDIFFRIRERDEEGNTLKVIADGVFGEWSLGQNVEIGLARISDYEICFYTPANSTFIIIKLFEKMNDFDSSVEIFAGAGVGSINTITGTVSNVDIIYPDNLMVFKNALPQKGVVVVPMF